MDDKKQKEERLLIPAYDGTGSKLRLKPIYLDKVDDYHVVNYKNLWIVYVNDDEKKIIGDISTERGWVTLINMKGKLNELLRRKVQINQKYARDHGQRIVGNTNGFIIILSL